jgi:hypothetical protein
MLRLKAAWVLTELMKERLQGSAMIEITMSTLAIGRRVGMETGRGMRMVMRMRMRMRIRMVGVLMVVATESRATAVVQPPQQQLLQQQQQWQQPLLPPLLQQPWEVGHLQSPSLQVSACGLSLPRLASSCCRA